MECQIDFARMGLIDDPETEAADLKRVLRRLKVGKMLDTLPKRLTLGPDGRLGPRMQSSGRRSAASTPSWSRACAVGAVDHAVDVI